MDACNAGERVREVGRTGEREAEAGERGSCDRVPCESSWKRRGEARDIGVGRGTNVPPRKLVQG